MNNAPDTQSWDPLDAANNSDQEILTSAKKREIKNILKSYVGSYDSMSELIQNAMDAVEKRISIAGSDYQPKINITINVKENSFQIVDNGVGFGQEQFRAFLAPNISFKSGQKTRGNKGVGATYIAYGFNDLEIRTKNADFEFHGRFRDGRTWVDDVDGTIHRPQMQPISSNYPSFEKLESGTSVKITYGGVNTRPRHLDWYQASTPDQWLYLLMIKTPLGHIALNGDTANKIKFDITVVDKAGNSLTKLDCNCCYKYPHEEIKASHRVSVIQSTQAKALEQGKDAVKAIEKYRNSNGIYDYFGTDFIKSKVRMMSDEVNLVEQYKISAYGYFAYSTAIWDQLNDNKAKLRKGYRVLRGGLQMANNHMGQGDLITIPLTKNTGHQNQAHIIVHLDGADPDLGRKGFQPELKELAEKISIYLVGYLSNRRDVLKSDTGALPDIEKDIKVHDWMRAQEEHERDHPLTLTNENFFLPTKKISIRSTPLCEQDAIVLFNQLLAGGVIRGIDLLSTSQVSQYDGMFRYVAKDPLSNLEFDKEINPLGVYSEQLSSPYQGPPRIIEYKFNLDGLIREFESGVKVEKDITLAVFWEFGEEYKREYSALSLLDFDNIQQRKHHGITHIVKSATSQFDAICLKELIALLNDPEGQQALQKSWYGDDI